MNNEAKAGWFWVQPVLATAVILSGVGILSFLLATEQPPSVEPQNPTVTNHIDTIDGHEYIIFTRGASTGYRITVLHSESCPNMRHLRVNRK